MIPGQGAKILHALQPKKKQKNQNINNRSSIVTNAIDFKNGLHKKKIFKKTI